jgi:hypothetical protein
MTKTRAVGTFRFEGARTENLMEILDGVAWLSSPDEKSIALFAGVDPRTAAKVLRNLETIGLVVRDQSGGLGMSLPYPHKGPLAERGAVVREAMVRMPLLRSVRQFLKLGESQASAARKAAALHGIEKYDEKGMQRLLGWADEFSALDPTLDVETLVEQAEHRKAERISGAEGHDITVFLSHATPDKEIVRRLATDLVASGVQVWLDEQRILVGDSIVERLSQGLAETDFLVFVATADSVSSEWARRELNSALMSEISRRRVTVLPALFADCELPAIISDKRYADFRTSYNMGFQDLLTAIKGEP